MENAMDAHRPAEVFPPGDFVKEAMDGRDWTQEDLAKIIDKPLPAVNQIIKGKRAITPETAKKLAAAFETSAEFWMNLESAWQLRGKNDEGSDRVRWRVALYERAPIREMERRGWIKKTKSAEELEQELKRFFAVPNLDESPPIKAAGRASAKGDDSKLTPAQWAWCRRASQMARMVHAKRFVPEKLEQLISALRRLMRDPEETGHVPKLLSEFGVRFVVVEHLSHTKMDGAALWTTPESPVVAMSMRYARLDYFWFTLLHEIAHILNQDGERADPDILEITDDLDEAETRANRHAADWLIPRDRFESFVVRTSPLYSTQKITNFAKRFGVHPAIVVGQLKNRGELDWSRFARLQLDDIRSIIKQVAICDGWGHVAPVVEGR